MPRIDPGVQVAGVRSSHIALGVTCRGLANADHANQIGGERMQAHEATAVRVPGG